MGTEKIHNEKNKKTVVFSFDINKNLTANKFQLATFTIGCTTLLITLAKCIIIIIIITSSSSTLMLNEYYKSFLAMFIGYIAADLGTGIYHWAVDNYGNLKNLVFGNQTAGYLYHHVEPPAANRIQIPRKLFPGAAVATIVVTPVNLLSNDPRVLAFVFAFAGFYMFGMQIHAWAHTPRSKLPRLVAVLQDVGVLISPAKHAPHHRPPHNVCYCSVSGVWNKVLDRSGFFRVLEVLIFKAFGVEPRSWGTTMVHVQADHGK